ncbi:hypothetical protein L1987_42334 [Smallanthus sonchifolius]|uniref:Uncharacterized protein n=1 Tax=Smallanthus sonchifolius TaxID=185202 RepID=A0ACB9GJP0_9ASTR|nr:hypothetical protein L1987_42334 [Smallanthus sonchifolius]
MPTSKMIQDCEDSSKKRKRDGSLQPQDFLDNPPSSKRSVLDTELHLVSPMPLEWQRCLDIKSGQIYYYNTRTRKKTSMDPGEPPKNMSLDLELNLPCGSADTPKKHHVADNFTFNKHSTGDGWLALEGGDQQQEMMTAVCKKCHIPPWPNPCSSSALTLFISTSSSNPTTLTTVHSVLTQHGFPIGLLPTDLNRTSGEFSVDLGRPCRLILPPENYLATYSKKVTGKIGYSTTLNPPFCRLPIHPYRRPSKTPLPATHSSPSSPGFNNHPVLPCIDDKEEARETCNLTEVKTERGRVGWPESEPEI